MNSKLPTVAVPCLRPRTQRGAVVGRPQETGSGFTRLELVVLVSALVLLCAAALPVLANTRPRSQRLVCVSNLARVGQAYAVWGSDHADYYPFLLSPKLGGTRTPFNGLEINPWFQFSWISNELATPRVLACPSDTKVRAESFSAGPGGFLGPNYRNNAVSYFLSYPLLPYGHVVLSGDRNIKAQRIASCVIFGPGVAEIVAPAGAPFTPWEPRIHGESGNLLLSDGAVEQTGSPELNRMFNGFPDNSTRHLIIP